VCIISFFFPPLYIFCQSGANAVVRRKSIVQNGGYPALDRVEPAVKAYIGLKTALYKVFRVSTYIQNRVDKMDI